MSFWFKCPNTLLDEERVGTLPDAALATFWGLLCAASKTNSGGVTGVTRGNAGWLLRRDDTEETLAILIERGLIAERELDRMLIVPSWERMQERISLSTSGFYPSSKERALYGFGVRFLSERQIDVRSSSVAVRMIPLSESNPRQTRKPSVESRPDEFPISTLQLTQHAIDEFESGDLNSGQDEGDGAPSSGLES